MKDVVLKLPFVLFLLTNASGIVGCALKPTLDMFRTDDPPCYDRSVQPQTPVVDTHLHFRPFGGPAIPFSEVVSYLEKTGVLFVNIYGIGQMLPAGSSCTYYLDCPGTPVKPSLKNDFLASRDKNFNVYQTELRITSRIIRYLDDNAYRNIALGQNYFRLLGLEYTAPPVCVDRLQ